MGSEIIIIPSLLACIFAIAYLFFSTRNKERMALIEKGAEASIFKLSNKQASPVFKIALLNFALLLIGIGTGVALAAVLHAVLDISEEVVFTASIFLTAGIALLIGFYLSKKF